jgi:hypothetical protein
MYFKVSMRTIQRPDSRADTTVWWSAIEAECEIVAAKRGGSWVYGAFKTEAKWAGQLSK